MERRTAYPDGREDLSEFIINYEREFMLHGDPGNGSNDTQSVRWLPWSQGEGAVKGINLDADLAKAIISTRSERVYPNDIRKQIDSIRSSELQKTIRRAAHSLFGFV